MVSRKNRGDLPHNPYLAELVYACRIRLAAPGAKPPSQARIADAAGMHLNTYSEIEAGMLRQREVEDLERLADVLHMAAGERRSMFLLALGREAPTRPGATADNPEFYAEFINHHRSPAFVHDRVHTIVAVNDAMRRIFPNWVVGMNAVTYVLEDRRAREELLQWHERWAPLLLRVLKTRAVESRDPQILAQYEDMRKQIAADAPVGRHSDDGDIGGKRMPDGSIYRFRLHNYKPFVETPSEYLVVSFEPPYEQARPLIDRDALRQVPQYTTGRWRIPERS